MVNNELKDIEAHTKSLLDEDNESGGATSVDDGTQDTATNKDSDNIISKAFIVPEDTKSFITSNPHLKIISGIDTLYYFVETNEHYDDLYFEVMDSMDTVVGRFERNEEEYQNEDVSITINKHELIYIGNAMGFSWFRDRLRLFKIGFKDKEKNRNLHNIQVQLLASGIYTVGLKTLLGLIDDMLDGYITGNKPVTRADLNAFVSFDFSFLQKHMFVTKKKSFREMNTFYNGQEPETFYVGKNPFTLRIYNKKLELAKNTSKQEIMEEFFANNDLPVSSPYPIWNIEFELHRDYLRRYDVKTIDELLANAKNLFYECMNIIRLIDDTTLTREMIASGHSNRAETLLVWKAIQESYTLDWILQNNTPLEALKRKAYKYTVDDAIREHYELGRKARLNGIITCDGFYKEVKRKVDKGFEMRSRYQAELEKLKANIIEAVEFNYDTGEVRKIRLNKHTRMPIMDTLALSSLTDRELVINHEELIIAIAKVPRSRLQENIHYDKIEISRKELLRRGLIEDDIDEPLPF
jgi:hypothetical protein